MHILKCNIDKLHYVCFGGSLIAYNALDVPLAFLNCLWCGLCISFVLNVKNWKFYYFCLRSHRSRINSRSIMRAEQIQALEGAKFTLQIYSCQLLEIYSCQLPV